MRKLMWFAIGFAIAALLGVYFLSDDALLIFAVVCVVLAAASLLLYRRFPKAAVAVILLCGCMISFLWQFGYASVYLSVPRAADGMYGTFEIRATDYSEETDYGGAVEGYVRLNGRIYKVRAHLSEDVSLSPGDCVTGYFQLKATLPDCLLDSSYYRSSGIFLVAYPKGHMQVTYTDQLPWYGYPAYVRQSVSGMVSKVFPTDVAGYARALLLGDGDGLDYETDTAFKVSGIRHIVAVSGLHVSILFSLIFLLTGKRKHLASVLGIPVLMFFAAVAGFTPSITRACVMHGLMSIAFLLKKEYDAPTALSFAVLLMLMADPWTVSNVSFQLSVGCVIGILLFSERIQAWLLDKKRLGKYKGHWGKLLHWLTVSVSVSLSATVITTPLCALYFGMVSLVSVLTNLLTLWIISFTFYGIVLACVLGVIFLPAASVLAWIVAIPMRYVLFIARVLASFPLAAVYIKSAYIIFWLVFCYILLAAFLLMKRKRPIVMGCCCGLALCLALTASWTEPLLDECRVTVLDVGQGQCILLQSEGKNYLVDCGGDSATAAADEAAALLLSQGISRLDGLILTHFDADHAEGAGYLLTRVPADCIYLPEALDEAGIGQQLMRSADCPVYVIRENIVISYGNSHVTLIPSKFAMTDNESGLCVLFQTENYDILITGDRGFSGEAELLRDWQLPQLELLIVGHHGSRYSTSPELLAATSPEVAIISVSADNRFSHPTQEVLDRLAECGCTVYRTDRDGTIIFRG